jgi:hypothetical protein
MSNFWFKVRYYLHFLIGVLLYLGAPFATAVLVNYFFNPDLYQYGWGIFFIIWIIVCWIIGGFGFYIYAFLRFKFKKFDDYLNEIERYNEDL